MLISSSRLPPALMDLTLLRVSNSHVLRGHSSKWNTVLYKGVPAREMHQAALAIRPDAYQYQEDVDVSGPSMTTGYVLLVVILWLHLNCMFRQKSRFGSQGPLTARPAEIPAGRQITELERRVQALQQAVASEVRLGLLLMYTLWHSLIITRTTTRKRKLTILH
jgi:hypothetical protein